jgi:hypothetical protein
MLGSLFVGNKSPVPFTHVPAVDLTLVTGHINKLLICTCTKEAALPLPGHNNKSSDGEPHRGKAKRKALGSES